MKKVQFPPKRGNQMVAALKSMVFASGLSETSARMLDAAGSHIHSNTTTIDLPFC
ncbi:MAG: hypothetical protein IKR81_01870 [Victivallales bacterium]|nr:hypothetical protein [Victivallales bacterium]